MWGVDLVMSGSFLKCSSISDGGLSRNCFLLGLMDLFASAGLSGSDVRDLFANTFATCFTGGDGHVVWVM